MAKRNPKPKAIREEVIKGVRQECHSCGTLLMWNKYDNYRTVRTLMGVVQLRLKIRCCQNSECERWHKAYRPEAEGKWALPSA